MQIRFKVQLGVNISKGFMKLMGYLLRSMIAFDVIVIVLRIFEYKDSIPLV